MSKIEANRIGFSFLEIIISVGFLIIITQAFLSLISTSFHFLGLSRTQSSARALANQQLELIRNIPYSDVGTISGIPIGTIPQTQYRQLNGQDYTINTSIVYIDDPFDNKAPTDLLPVDYKRVRVKVTWNGPFSSQDGITLITDIVPKGIESMTGGGTLGILVFDADGIPIPQAQVHITAPTLSPPIDLSLDTDNNGNLILPGAPICTTCYKITVSKEGYSTDQTYSTSEVTNPIMPYQTILENQITQISFSIDHTANLTIKTYNYPSLTEKGSTNLLIKGDKTIGTDTDGNPVYKFSHTINTNNQGHASIDLEWDNYTITSTEDFLFAGSNPISPITLIPEQFETISIAFHSPVNFSLLNLVKDASGSAIPNVTNKISKSSGYEATTSTGLENDMNFGFSWFTLPESGIYTLELSHPQYETATTSVSINSNEIQSYILNKIN